MPEKSTRQYTHQEPLFVETEMDKLMKELAKIIDDAAVPEEERYMTVGQIIKHLNNTKG